MRSAFFRVPIVQREYLIMAKQCMSQSRRPLCTLQMVALSIWAAYFELIIKGLAKLGNIVVETMLQRQMFPSLCACRRNTRCGSKFCVLEARKCFWDKSKAFFASQTQFLLPKRTFPSLATQGNMSRNNVSATMFPSLARPFVFLRMSSHSAWAVKFKPTL